MSIASLYPSINPSLLLDFANSKVLDPRITFTRTTTATYYDGVTTAKAEENLLLYSQDVTNAAWTARSSTTTANTVAAPDGTTTADTVTQGSSVSLPCGLTYSFGTALRPNVYTFSGYVKYKSSQFLSAKITSGSASYAVAIIDLVANTATSYAQSGNCSNSSVTMTSVGSGWYRFTLTTTVVTTTVIDVSLFFSPSATPTVQSYGDVFITGDGTSGVYVWGFQFEERSSATAYTATTTQAITNYIPVLQTASSGQARFDHNPTTGESLGLLIEEARTNLLTYSEDFSNAAWTKGGCSVSANAIVAPDGTLTGDRLVEDTTNGDHRAFQLSSFTSGTAYTFTVYAKQAGRSLLQLANIMAGGYTATFDLAAGTVSNTATGTATITNVGNGWYRCSVSNTSTFTGNANNQIRLVNTGTNTSYTGDGWSGVFVWGAQLEAGSFATSYIPTVAATVTRNADAASMTGTNFSSWFNNGEGTIYAEGASQPSTSTISGGNAASILNIGGATADDMLPRLARNVGGTGRYAYYVNGGYVAQFTDLGSWSNSTNGKLAGVYKANDFAASFNGGAVQTDTTGVLGVANKINIGRLDSDGYWNSTIKKIAYYPVRATNAQLQALTS